MLIRRLFAKWDYRSRLLNPNSCRDFSTPASSIFALASAANQKCGVAVVRLSGKKCADVLRSLTKKNELNYEPRKMYLKNIYHPVSNEKIDKGLIVWFKEPNSFTGEDVAEFHVHGGPAVVQSLLGALASFDGLRYAEPGEFSRRAFLNGRMDLVEVEGLADLVNAETEMQRKQALAQMEGSLSKLYKGWREEITKCLANVEAFIDFHEEENIEEDVLSVVDAKIKELIASIASHVNDNRKGERLRDGAKVVIIGQPNAGKSSLLNSLCKRPAAIVSSIAGTTRDVIESAINIGGYPVVLSDTAGLRKTQDEIEIEGVKRACERIDTADLLIIVVDTQHHLGRLVEQGAEHFLLDHMRNDLNMDDPDAVLQSKQVVVCLNKMDLISHEQRRALQTSLDSSRLSDNIQISKVSCIENQIRLGNIEELLTKLKEKLSSLCSDAINELPAITQQRYRDNLTKCRESLENYLVLAKSSHGSAEPDFAIVAEELRVAARWLGLITGQVTSEQILDVIFRDFCIGK